MSAETSGINERDHRDFVKHECKASESQLILKVIVEEYGYGKVLL